MRPLRGAGGGQDPLGDVEVGAGDPGRDGAQVIAGQGGGVEVAAQVVTRLGGPEAAVFDALLGDGEGERIRPANGGGRVLTALDRDQQNVDGTSPMCWGLKTCTGPSSARTALVRAWMSGLVVVAMTGPR